MAAGPARAGYGVLRHGSLPPEAMAARGAAQHTAVLDRVGLRALRAFACRPPHQPPTPPPSLPFLRAFFMQPARPLRCLVTEDCSGEHRCSCCLLYGADFLLHVEAGALVPSPTTVRAAATDIEEVRAALALQLGLTDVKVSQPQYPCTALQSRLATARRI